ncbi:MAG: hypothetical protein V1837_02770 [Candidatus Woesearchaeota archaeon]
MVEGLEQWVHSSRTVRAEKPWERVFAYNIRVNPKLNSRESVQQYFLDVVDYIATDAKLQDSIDQLVIDVEVGYRQFLREAAKARVDESVLQMSRRSTGSHNSYYKFPAVSGLVLGVAAGAAAWYPTFCGWATDFGTYINQYSKLLAPLSGLVQFTVVAVPTAAKALLGAAIGDKAARLIAAPFVKMCTPMATKAVAYEKVQRAVGKLA